LVIAYPVRRGFRLADVLGFEVMKCVDAINRAILCCEAGLSNAPVTGSSPTTCLIQAA
jgi:hypothetical protein